MNGFLSRPETMLLGYIDSTDAPLVYTVPPFCSLVVQGASITYTCNNVELPDGVVSISIDEAILYSTAMYNSVSGYVTLLYETVNGGPMIPPDHTFSLSAGASGDFTLSVVAWGTLYANVFGAPAS